MEVDSDRQPNRVASSESRGESSVGNLQPNRVASSESRGASSSQPKSKANAKPKSGKRTWPESREKNRLRPVPEGDSDAEPATEEWAKAHGLNRREARETEDGINQACRTKNSGYPCSSCSEKFVFSEICPLYPDWFNWQGNFIQVCFPCVQTVTGPATPWTITSEEIPEGEGAVRLAGMASASASSGEGHPPPPYSATEEFAIAPYKDLASMVWKVP